MYLKDHVSYFQKMLNHSQYPLENTTDKYFTKSKQVIAHTGTVSTMKYGVFVRVPMLMAIQPLVAMVKNFAPNAKVTPLFSEGQYVPEETCFVTIEGGPELTETETRFLQVASLPGICAFNAYKIIQSYPNVPMLDMHARHGYSPDMNLLCSYGASVATRKARAADVGVGFVGSSIDICAPFFDETVGRGTMPHMLVGAFDGDLLESAKAYVEVYPDENLSVLVDYEGKEVDDTVRVAEWFFNEYDGPKKGVTMSARLDTNGARFLQGLDYAKSVEVVCEHINARNEWDAVRKVIGADTYDYFADDALKDKVRRTLFGKGVTAGAIIHMRNELDRAGFSHIDGRKVAIVGSSGFDMTKTRIMANANAPVDLIGTGSFLPNTLKETYSTADVFAYDGEFNVKAGRQETYRSVHKNA